MTKEDLLKMVGKNCSFNFKMVGWIATLKNKLYVYVRIMHISFPHGPVSLFTTVNYALT